MQAQLDKVLGLGLHRTVSRDSIVSLAGSTNTKKAYKKFIKGLLAIGVTADMINEKEKEIQDIFKPQHPAASDKMNDSDLNQSLEVGKDVIKPQHPAASCQMGDSNQNQLQVPDVGTSSDAETSPISATMLTESPRPRRRSRFGWTRPPIDSLVGPLMLSAAEAGNTKRLISTLEYVRNINFVDDKKETALHKAAANGHEDTVQLLLSKGALTEAMNSSYETALHGAASSGHTRTVELLLSKGALIEARNSSQETPLRCAASTGHTGTVELLLSKGAPIEARSSSQETPLHHAAWTGHTGTVELLISKGAPIEVGNSSQETPLHQQQRNVRPVRPDAQALGRLKLQNRVL